MASQSRATRILLTRPADQGARFAADLTTRFGDRVTIAESPLIAPRLLSPTLPVGPFDAVLFTSETAVSAATALPGLPPLAFAVGDRTAAAARAAGFTAISGRGDASYLVELVIRARPGRVLHLHGQETRGDVVGALRQAGVKAEGAVVYVQDPQPLTAEAQHWLDDDLPVIVPLFSPRTAALFAATRARAPLWLASLSPAVDAAATCPAARRVTAATPDAAAMLRAVGSLLGPPSDP
ncbi:MAG: uroporphyrinogen-III synthase [Gemmobacter sp.]